MCELFPRGTGKCIAVRNELHNLIGMKVEPVKNSVD
jgi:hypothetical protein